MTAIPFTLETVIADTDVRIRGDYYPAESEDPSVGYPGSPAQLDDVTDVTRLDPWCPLTDAEVTAFAVAHRQEIEDALREHLDERAEIEAQEDECRREDAAREWAGVEL